MAVVSQSRDKLREPADSSGGGGVCMCVGGGEGGIGRRGGREINK